MSFKSLTAKVTGKIGRQVLTAKHHSPVLMVGAGIVGVGTSVVLACKATLKLNDVLAEGEAKLEAVDPETESEHKEKSFGVQLQTAIKIARLYAPSALIGVGSVGLIAGSHIILKKRNAGLAAAYAIVHKSFDEYRGRVIEDQGKEKDLEYRFGTAEREIVEEGKNGPETKVIKGPDQEALKANPHTYARIFDEYNKNWSKVPHDNQHFIQSMQLYANDLLRLQGYVFLNDVYEMLGMEKSKAGQLVGWVKGHKEGERDGYIDFGVWNSGVFHGKEWVNGNYDSIMLDFNVDGVVLDILKES